MAGGARLRYDNLVHSASHHSTLNPAQRAAVTFGVPAEGRLEPGPPLLVIAGAGSGKTNTLAHRVAHLILNGADPRRILLLTFTRRAAEAMTRRAEQICEQVRNGAAIPYGGACGRARSTRSAPACSGSMPSRSASIPASPCSIAAMPPT